MGVITDKQLQARPGAKDVWLMEDGPRGAGRFVARITPAGERLFYYRYTDPLGDRVRLPLGSYPAMSVKQARTKFEPRWPLQIPPPVATPNSRRQDGWIMRFRG